MTTVKLVGGPRDGTEVEIDGKQRTLFIPEADGRGVVYMRQDAPFPNGSWYRLRVYNRDGDVFKYSHATKWGFQHSDWCDPSVAPWRPAPPYEAGDAE